MARTRILIVDDELGILDLVQYNLSKAQYDAGSFSFRIGVAC
jgi:DNA-binding response OmpR family regulator